jgi:hypothetical protein
VERLKHRRTAHGAWLIEKRRWEGRTGSGKLECGVRKKMKEGRWKDRGWEIERMGNWEWQYGKTDGSFGKQD